MKYPIYIYANFEDGTFSTVPVNKLDVKYKLMKVRSANAKDIDNLKHKIKNLK